MRLLRHIERSMDEGKLVFLPASLNAVEQSRLTKFNQLSMTRLQIFVQKSLRNEDVFELTNVNGVKQWGRRVQVPESSGMWKNLQFKDLHELEIE
eukprot:3697863-Amphidinium_carterae.1